MELVGLLVPLQLLAVPKLGDQGFFCKEMPERDPLDIPVLTHRVNQDVFPKNILVIHRLPDFGVLHLRLARQRVGQGPAHYRVLDGYLLEDGLPAHAANAPAGEKHIADGCLDGLV